MKKILLIISLFTIANIFAQEKKVKIYPFKSAIIEYKYEAQLSGTHIKYIDDYGYKQADYIIKNVNFGKSEEKNETIIIIGNRAYSINNLDSTVNLGKNNTYLYYTKYKNKTGVEINEAIDAKASGWKYTGNKQFLEKDCKIWESRKSIRYTWNSIIFYDEINFMIMMVEKATKIEIDIEIPNEIFEIPTGYKFNGGSGTQVGFKNLDLDFDKIKIVDKKDGAKESTKIEIEFNSADYIDVEGFTFYNEKGNIIELEGINDYENYDNKIIKSQDYALSNKKQKIYESHTVFFKTPKGEYGKMQITEINKEDFKYQYVIFNKHGLIKEYNKSTNNGLVKVLDINKDENNDIFYITPIKGSKILIIQ